MSRPADPYAAPTFLLTMPLRVLRSQARTIEKWCAARGKSRPTLLHLTLAREARRSETP